MYSSKFLEKYSVFEYDVKMMLSFKKVVIFKKI